MLTKPWKVNETISKEYLGVVGETNHVDLIPMIIGATHHHNHFWDRRSGILTEYNYSISIVIPSFPTTELHFRIAASDPPWPIPEFPSLIILPVFMSATLLIVITYRRKYTSARTRKIHNLYFMKTDEN